MKRQQITNTQKSQIKKLFSNANDIFAQIKIQKSQKNIVGQDSMIRNNVITEFKLMQVLKLHKINPVLTIPKDFQQYINIFQEYAEFDVHLEKSASRVFCQKHYRHIYFRFLESYCSLKQAQIQEIDQNRTLIDWMDWLENNVVFRHPSTIKKQQIIIPQFQQKTQASISKTTQQVKINTPLQKFQVPILKSQPSIQDLQKQYKQTMAKRKQKFQIKKQPKNSNKTNKKGSKKSQEKNKTQEKNTTQKKSSRQKKKEQTIQKNDKQRKKGQKNIIQQQDQNFDQFSSLSIRSSQIQRLRIQSSQQKKQQEENQSLEIKKIQVNEISNKVNDKNGKTAQINSNFKEFQKQIQVNKLDDSVVEIQKPVSIMQNNLVQIIEISQEEPQKKNQFKLKMSQNSSGIIIENGRGNRFKREMQDENSLSRGRFLLSTTPPFNLKKKSKEFILNQSFDLEKQVQHIDSEIEEDSNNLKRKYSPKTFNTMKRLSACLANQQLRYYIMPQMVRYH